MGSNESEQSEDVGCCEYRNLTRTVLWCHVETLFWLPILIVSVTSEHLILLLACSRFRV